MSESVQQLFQLKEENKALRMRLEESEETLTAIQNGEVDAIVVHGPKGEQIFSLKSVDHSFRILVEEMHEGAMTLSKNGLILYANKFMAEIIATPLEKIIGANIMQFVNAADLPVLNSFIRQNRKESTFTEIQLKGLKGPVVPVCLSITHLSSEEMPIFCMAFTDLSAQKRHELILAEERLKRVMISSDLKASQEMFSKAFQSNAAMMIVCTLDEGLIVDVNDQFLKTMGFPKDEVIGKTTSSFRIFKDFDVMEGLVKRIKENGSVRNHELEVKTRNGNLRYVLLSGDILQLQESKRLMMMMVDITEKKALEEKFRHSQKIESIGTLTGGIAHDFNNIMGIILGNTELALEDVPKWNPGHTNLEEIRKASLRAANIVRQLLSFTRITDQKLQPMEIGLVIKDALKFLRSTIPTIIDIEQDICVTDETILADPTQINQIMMNLCINASHAMEQTGGKLTINVENVTLDDLSAKDYPDLKRGKYIKVVVSDTGPGIDPKIIDRIFDPYFTTKGVGKGSGMGLAVVHGIVKSHNGTIAVDSTPGKGTEFSILFPLAHGKEAVEAETIQAIPRGSETILFVDDEISIVNMVQRMFERLGYKVQTATTPQDALDRFALNPDHFDLVITDMTMPQMTGVNLSEKLMDIRPDIPIIICTGHSALVDEEKAKELGLAAYIMKPINMRETAQIIRKILDKN